MPRRPEQFEELREKSREKILSASLELFANKGYDSTSIESIAKKAGMSKGLIYNYYESKKGILLAIFDEAMMQGEYLINKHKDVKDPHKKIRAMIDQVFEMMETNREYMKLLTVLSLQPGVMADTKDLSKKMYERNKEMVVTAFSSGKDKDPTKGLMLDALIDGVLLNYIRYGSEYPLAQMKARIIKEYCTPDTKLK